MKVALLNPNWTFHGSIYFGCRAPHLPVELGFAKALLEKQGDEVLLLDAHLFAQSITDTVRQVEPFSPDIIAITTAPTYLFWRCPQPELNVPRQLCTALRNSARRVVAAGPHCSVTPAAACRKMDVDAVVIGECEEVLAQLAATPFDQWARLPSVHIAGADNADKQPHFVEVDRLPALHWAPELLKRHAHHHHRFDEPPVGPGAEVEASRGCPYRCTFCAKNHFRRAYRRRPLDVVLEEIDALIAQRIEYIYFIDELFMPDEKLMQALARRNVKYGIQTRIDLWTDETLDTLGGSGCVSVEAGMESISESARDQLAKKCRLSTEEMTDLLVHAKKSIRFVQANLVQTDTDDPAAISRWRRELQQYGVWANEPVPLFPFPGSPAYEQLWGKPDDFAWERAHDYYLGTFANWSDLQDQQPLSLRELEKVT